MKADQLEQLTPYMSRHPARLEVLLSEMMRRGLLREDEIELELISTFARNWAKDVHKARIVERKQGPRLQIKVNREGIFDQLPPNFFHQPDRHQPNQKLKQRLSDAEMARLEEKSVRKFFYPFEQMLFRFRLRVETNESQLADGFESPLRRELLLSLWPSCRALPESYYPLLSYVLPLSYRVAGELELMGICYSTVLRLPVAFERQYICPAQEERLPGSFGRLLGQDFELSGRPTHALATLVMTIGPIARDEAHDYLPGGNLHPLLQLLNDCLVPMEYDLRLDFDFHKTDGTFRLGDREHPAPALGYHTLLMTQSALP